jgi:phage terminase small subunit
MDTQLTFRQERFVFEYLQDQNASAAAARAGYSEKWRASAANDLMKSEAVRERIRIEMESLLAELRCSALMLMKERMRAAFFRAGKMFSAGWELLAPDEMEAETRDALEVSTVIRKSGPVVRMKQPDRDRALRALERVHERLDRLNEAHYAKMEKAGAVASLEDFERRADALLEEDARLADVVAQQAGDLSGLGANEEIGLKLFCEKPRDLLGSAPQTGTPGRVFPFKPRVLSGWEISSMPQPQASPWLLHDPLAASAQLRAA